MRKYLIPLIIVVVVAVLAIVYFASTSKPSEEAMPSMTGEAPAKATTGGSTPSPAPAPKQTGGTIQVDIKGFSFVGQTTRISPGTTILWKNFDDVRHTVTSDTGVFSSAALSKGQTFSYKFTKEGTYTYHCSIHPEMTGEIIVRAYQ